MGIDSRGAVPPVTTPTGQKLPRLALPELDEPGEIARYVHGQGLPGEFPFVNAAYREMYLDAANGLGESTQKAEEPTRLFAGLGLAEDTNALISIISRTSSAHWQRLNTTPSMDPRFTVWTAMPRAFSERSAKEESQLIPSKTWNGSSPGSSWETNMLRFR